MVAQFILMNIARAASPWIAQPNWTLPNVTATLAVADLNGDGKLDLLYGNNSGQLVAYQNTGDNVTPVWSTPPANWTTLTACAGGGAGSDYSPGIVDLDGDGLPDLVLGSTAGVCVYRNTGTSSQPAWTRMAAWESGGGTPLTTFNTANGHYQPATFADVNGDGLVDMLLIQFPSNEHVLINTGTSSVPAWTEATTWSISDPPLSRTGWAWADLDGDGRIDRLTASTYGYVYAYANSGASTSPVWNGIALNWSLFPAGATTGQLLYVADLNGDNRPDLLYKLSNTVMSIYYQSPPLGTPYVPTGLPPVTGLYSETFDSFSCSGAWQPDSNGPNTSYSRNCGNGWKAYAEDMSNTVLTPDPLYSGPVGNQNIVTLDSTVNGPSDVSGSPTGAVLMNTAPGVAPRGALWLLKTLPVQPGVPIQVLRADTRTLYQGNDSQRYSVMVFDGAVTSPYGQTASGGAPLRSDLLAYNIFSTSQSQTCSGTTIGNWCPWQQADLIGGNFVTPTQAFITVAFRLDDTSTTAQVFAEFDNLVVSNVTASAGSPVPVSDVAQLWSANYLASGNDNGASAADIAIDGSGNSYVVGTQNNGTDYDIVTLKYDDAGNLVSAPWLALYDGGNDDQAVAIALDATGNINVLGRKYNGTDNGYVVLKYNSSGTSIWSGPAVYDSTTPNPVLDEVPTAMAVDSSGNVYVTGTSCGTSGCDYLTVKFNAADGTVAWHQLYDSGGDDHAVAIKLDASGNVYVTGTATGGNDDVVTVKYDSTGTQLWASRYNSGATDRATAMAVDGSGNSYVVGYTYSAGNPALLVLKYGPAGGTPLWSRTYIGSSGQVLPSALTLDASGNVYITGKSGAIANYDMVTLKYLSDGSLAWAKTFGNAGLNDYGTNLALDGSGFLYVLGVLSPATGDTNLVTVKYDTAGTVYSAITYDAGVSDVPAALALGVDGGGDTTAYVAATSVDFATGLNEIDTLRYEKAQPDLTMTLLTTPAQAPIGGDISVTSTALNVSDLANKIGIPVDAFTINFYLAPDSDHNNRTLVGTRDVSALAVGGSDTNSSTVTIPASTASGTYVLIAVADGPGAVAEANEGNNSITSAVFSVGAPDFQVNSVSTASTAMTRGNTYTVTTSVQNIGGYDSPAGTTFRVGIYLSTDNVITTGDILIGSRTITSLASTAIDTADTTVTIPTGMAAGSYYLGAIVDDQNAVVETNDANNTGVYYLAGNTVLLDTDGDFNPGLSVSGTAGVVVNGTGTAATVILDKDTSAGAVAWQAPSPAWPSPLAVTGMQSYAFGDLNGDGIQDMVVGVSSTSGSKVYGYSNSSAITPAWTRESTWDVASPCGSDFYSTPILVDLDGDGLLDMVVGTKYYTCVLKNTGSSSAPVWSRANGTVAGVANWESGLPSTFGTANWFAPAAADLDGDGYPDLMLGSLMGGKVTAYKFSGINGGTGACNSATCWTSQSGWSVTPGGNRQQNPTLADLDGDGKVDMLVGSTLGVVNAFKNTCTVCSSGPVWSAAPGSWIPPSLGNRIVYPGLKDLTGDGKLDLVEGTNLGEYKPFLIIPPYLSTGTYYSAVQDAGGHGGYTALAYSSTLPTNTTLTVDVRAGSVATPDGTWTPWATNIANGGDISSLGTNRYVQFRINLGTTSAANGLVTPDLDTIQAYTNPATGPTQAIAIKVGGSSSGGGGTLGWMDIVAMLTMIGLGRALELRRLRGRSRTTYH